jgi:uncharacterized membrane protein
MSMKFVIAVSMMLSLMAVTGCLSTVSPQGGTLPQDKEFTVTVPTRSKVKQGESLPVKLSLNRGSFFKRDVQVEINSEGIVVTPARINIRASELPEAQLQIAAPRDAALGEYRVYVNATPDSGKTTSTEFTVKVIAP